MSSLFLGGWLLHMTLATSTTHHLPKISLSARFQDVDTSLATTTHHPSTTNTTMPNMTPNATPASCNLQHINEQ
jgi:hypothetical protein